MKDPESTQPPTRRPKDVPSPAGTHDTGTSFDTRQKRPAASTTSAGWRFVEGDTIASRFTVQRQLGRGGMGEVYAVRDEHAQEDRALKIMRADIADSDAARQRFRNESKVRRLNHECIVNTIDIGEAADQNLLYISMELVDGVSLREVMNERRLPIATSLQICYLLCKALEYAHQQSVIHRDIKPDNVLVKLDGDDVRVWLTDFGIAQLQMDGFTNTGSVFGTLAYASPEQKRSAANVTEQSDLYGVGVLLYELLQVNCRKGTLSLPRHLSAACPQGQTNLFAMHLQVA